MSVDASTPKCTRPQPGNTSTVAPAADGKRLDSLGGPAQGRARAYSVKNQLVV